MTHTFGLVDETRFWSRQLMEHMEILVLATEDPTLKSRAVTLHDRWNRYLTHINTETSTSSDNAAAHQEYQVAVNRLIAQYHSGSGSIPLSSQDSQLKTDISRIKSEQGQIAAQQALIAAEQSRLSLRLGTNHSGIHQLHLNKTSDEQRRLSLQDPSQPKDLINKHLQIALEQEQTAKEQRSISEEHAHIASMIPVTLTVTEKHSITRNRDMAIQHEAITKQHQTTLQRHQSIGTQIVRNQDQFMAALDSLNRQYQSRVSSHHVVIQQNISQLLMDTITYKRDLLTAAQSRWVGWAYPTLIQHLIKEAQYFQSKVNGHVMKPADEVAFWQQIQTEHAEVIAHLTDPVHNDIIMRLKTMVRDFNTANQLLVGYPTTIREYLMVGIAAQQVGQVNTVVTSYQGANLRSVIPPMLLNHIAQEGARATAVIQNVQKLSPRN